MDKKPGEYFTRIKNVLFSSFSFIIPFILYLLTLETKLTGGDTTWYALKIMKMEVFVPTGYPTFSLLGKAMTYLPVGDLTFRLNLFSAIFGALTILFLFLAINILVKNNWISIISSLCFAFIFPFWGIANRLEFDTLNSFFLVLVIYSAIIYNKNRKRKLLYLFFFCLGLSLTNHPITLFVVPAILLYVIIINPKIFKSIKAIFISIGLFILPLLSYFYILIRSLQGFGQVTDLKKLLYYISGRSVTGTIHGGSFGNKLFEDMIGVLKDYIIIIYESFGIVLVVIFIAGFIYLIKKNLKFAICSFVAIILNLVIIIQYLPFANQNYVIDSMLILTIYTAFGFLLVFDSIKVMFIKLLAGKKQIKADKILKYFTFSIIILFFAFQPASLIFENYNKADHSEPGDMYKFWDAAIGNIEERSIIYALAKSSNVGIFVNTYEYSDKDIGFIHHNDERYSVENAKEDFTKGLNVFFVGNEKFMNSFFKAEQIGRIHYWERYREKLRLFKILGIKAEIKIDHNIEDYEEAFGDIFTLEYIIKNNSGGTVNITSVELELPDNIEFVSVEPDGYIDQGPGISRGMYMWVSDQYIVDGNSQINLKINLRGTIPRRSIIQFRVTYYDNYINAQDIEIEIKP